MLFRSFIFAFYPELLLIPAAQIDPASSSGAYLQGYDGSIHLLSVLGLCARIAIGFYLLASALARFDHARLSLAEVLLRMGLALAVIASVPAIYITGLVITALYLVFHIRKNPVVRTMVS